LGSHTTQLKPAMENAKPKSLQGNEEQIARAMPRWIFVRLRLRNPKS